MIHPGKRHFPISAIILRLFFRKGFYGLFLELVFYGLIFGTYGLFLELVTYGLLYRNQAWSLSRDKWDLCCSFTFNNNSKTVPFFFFLLFPIRYFLLSLQGTYGKSLISKAQKIDKLPIDKRNLEIQNWRSKQRPTPASASAAAPATGTVHTQPPCCPVPPEAQQDFGASTSKSSSPPRQKQVEDWVLQGPRCSREHSKDDTCSRDTLAKLSSGECLLDPNRTVAPTAYSRGQKDASRHSSKGSHRRSQSSLTI